MNLAKISRDARARAWIGQVHHQARRVQKVAIRPSALAPAVASVALVIALYAAALALTRWSLPMLLVSLLAVTASGLFYLGVRRTGALGPLSIAAASILVSFVLRPLVLLQQPDAPDAGVAVFALTMLLATVAGMCTAVVLGLSQPLERILGRLGPDLATSRVIAAAAVSAAIGIVSLALLLVVTRFSPVQAFTRFSEFRVLISHDGLSYLSLPAMWGIWAPSWLIVAFIASKKGHVSRRWWVALAIAFMGGLVLAIPFGTRQALLSPAIGAAFIVDRLWKRMTPAFFVLATLLLFVVFTGYSVARELTFGELNPQTLAAGLARQNVGDLVARFEARFDSFDWMTKSISAGVLTERPPTYGGTVSNIVLQPIPRSLWRDKPYKTSAYLVTLTFGDAYELHFTPEFTLASESFVDFRWFGLIPSGLLLGVMLMSLERVAKLAGHSPAAAFVYAPLLMTPLGWLQAGFNSDWTIDLLILGGLSIAIARWISWGPQRDAVPSAI